MSAVTPGIWTVERWSSKESQVVAMLNGKKHLICAGVLPADAIIIAAAGNAHNRLAARATSKENSDG